ncbi:MAG TPA: AI-2E family transporter [Candidatus Paceibacterota bacterium]|jgi:predicted PurR-regulated permease PerM|nr:AI-2E family transporter [Candidatus Paceibacterota bacterium]
MKANQIEKYFFYALLAAVIIITLIIFNPFITTIILSVAFAIGLNPVYKWIKRHITRGISWLASLITVLLFIIVLCGPLFFIGTVIFSQAQNAYHSLISQTGETKTFLQSINIYVNKIIPAGFTFDIQSKIDGLVTFFINGIASFFTYTVTTAVLFLLMVVTTFYFLKDGALWKKSIVSLSPLSENHIKEIFLNLSNSINRTMRGSLIMTVAQGLFATIGFTIFHVPNPALWGVVAAFASFIPTIGTFMVSMPIMLFMYFTGAHMQALGILIWAVISVGMIDNILAPYVFSKNTDIPPIFILFSILGGISLMGPVGILIGPLVLSLLYSLISTYKKELKQN